MHGLVTSDCTRGVIDPLYHSRHNDRDRQYECDRGISRFYTTELEKVALGENSSTDTGDIAET